MKFNATLTASFGIFALAVISSIRGVFASPLSTLEPAALDLLDNDAREILERATPAAPHFVVYADSYDGNTGPPAASALKVS